MIHEKVLCKTIGFIASEGASIQSQLAELLSALKKGYKGNLRSITLKVTGLPGMDLRDITTMVEKSLFLLIYCLPLHFLLDNHGTFQLAPTPNR
jgi:hypothetical protein